MEYKQIIIRTFIVLIIIFQGCSKKTNDYNSIKKVLDLRTEALEKGNIQLYSKLIALNYGGNQKVRNNIIKKANGIFKNTKSRKIKVLDRAIYLKGNKATVIQKIRITMTFKNGQHRVIEGTEKILLKKINNKWKITGGL